MGTGDRAMQRYRCYDRMMVKYTLFRLVTLALALSMCSCSPRIARLQPQPRAAVQLTLPDVAAIGLMRPKCAGPCDALPPCTPYVPHGASAALSCTAL